MKTITTFLKKSHFTGYLGLRLNRLVVRLKTKLYSSLCPYPSTRSENSPITRSAQRFISLRACSSLGFMKLWSSENLQRTHSHSLASSIGLLAMGRTCGSIVRLGVKPSMFQGDTYLRFQTSSRTRILTSPSSLPWRKSAKPFSAAAWRHPKWSAPNCVGLSPKRGKVPGYGQ